MLSICDSVEAAAGEIGNAIVRHHGGGCRVSSAALLLEDG
jgi:hypothetical protein